MSKPRTQEELDQYYRELADYVDAGIQNWKRRYEPRYVSDRFDDIHYSDTKHAEAFPARKTTILKGDK